MSNRKILSEKRFSVNSKIIAFICLLVLGYQVSLYSEYDIDGFLLSDVFTLLGPLSVSVACFFVSKKYGFSNIFGKAYFSFGLGMFFYFLGEFTYMYYEYMLEIDPYPSFADVFYFLKYPFLIFYLQKNIRFFNDGVSVAAKIFLVVISLVAILSYLFFSLGALETAVLDSTYGLIFVSFSSATLSLAVFGVIVFRQNILITTWMLLAIAIFLSTVADVWYYHMEIFNMYDYTHPINSLWIASYCFMAYALFKHLKAL